MAVLGAGNFGTALAQVLAKEGREVVLWDHFPQVMEDIRRHRENRRFLPGVRLHPGLRVAASPAECVAGASLVLICTTSPFAVTTLAQAVPRLERSAILLNTAKGFAPRSRVRLPVALAQASPGHACAHLAGPVIANELARGQPAAIVLAATDRRVAARVADWLAGSALLPAITTDMTGAVLGGILKNVYAILLGGLDVLRGGRNLEAAVVTASVREMAAIATSCGSTTTTLYGLAGLGDLVATGFSAHSHNRALGQRLAAGQSAKAIARKTGWLPEGVRAARTACALARAGGVPAPLANLVRCWIAGTAPTLDGVLRCLRSGVDYPSPTPRSKCP